MLSLSVYYASTGSPGSAMVKNPLQYKVYVLYVLYNYMYYIIRTLYERKVKVAQSCPTPCDPMEYTVHGILQARILEWVAVPFSRVSSQPRDRTQVSRIGGRFFTS
ncbi:unnamed protein product [Rangifer tarandus platyrhynchus]|uniref:Uncharacterized protein n=1 Tax=Rangifer tarandus platyrhynchus TaxID=3082113 RepID=A0ABN8YHH4_RANTA|nr:unnamed protein product [Rangifer tarandus platyrhynchus]